MAKISTYFCKNKYFFYACLQESIVKEVTTITKEVAIITKEVAIIIKEDTAITKDNATITNRSGR